MKPIKNSLMAMGIICAASVALHAAGTTAAEFLKIGAGARPGGMGDAFVAVADETSGMYYNPAGLAFFYSPEVQGTHSLWLGDLTYNYLGYAHPTKSGTYGLGLQYLSGSSMQKYVEGVKKDEFSYYDGAATLLYAARISEVCSIGLNMRGIQSKIDDSNISALTGDLGFMYRTSGEGFSFGASGANLFGELGEDKLPATYRAGMAFKAALPEQSSDVLLALEAGQSDGSPLYYAAGVEHWGAKTLGLRLGYRYYTDEKQRKSLGGLAAVSAGFGLRIKSIAVDYAYHPFEQLGETHKITLTWRVLGWAVKAKEVSAQVKADPEIFSPNGDGAKDSVFFVPQIPEMKEVKSWELVIEDTDHNLVKKFAGKAMLPKILSWEGQTESGDQVQEGKYYYYFTAEGDGVKKARSSVGEIIADMTPPSVSLQVSSPVFTPSDKEPYSEVVFEISAGDMNNIDQWQLDVLNNKNKSVTIFKSTEPTPIEITWDGRDDFYGAVVPDGFYQVKVTAWDMAGNKSKTSAKMRISSAKPEPVKEAPKEIVVKQEARGLIVNLSSQVLFDVGKADLKPAASKALDEVVTLLQTYPENNVVIEGYTDSSGSRKKNIEISSARAWNVYSYLVKHGIKPSRLKPKGFGPDDPVGNNKTAVGRAMNRRVQIIILKK